LAPRTFFFDENISPRVAAALAALDFPVTHLLDHLPQGTPDKDFFPYIGEQGWVLVTQDKRIRKRPHERIAMRKAGLGAFILTGQADKTISEMTMLLLKHMPEMMKLSMKHEPPYIFGIPDRGKIGRL